MPIKLETVAKSWEDSVMRKLGDLFRRVSALERRTHGIMSGGGADPRYFCYAYLPTTDMFSDGWAKICDVTYEVPGSYVWSLPEEHYAEGDIGNKFKVFAPSGMTPVPVMVQVGLAVFDANLDNYLVLHAANIHISAGGNWGLGTHSDWVLESSAGIDLTWNSDGTISCGGGNYAWLIGLQPVLDS